jgi:hypothetical protein
VSDQHRPGGLTALAVINFIFGGLGLIGALGLAALLPMLAQGGAPGLSEEQRAQLDALTSLGNGPFLLGVASSAIGGLLLIVSGIGYLQQKRVLGRVLGNVYAAFAIATSIPMALWLPAQVGGGFNLSSILNFLYPVLTLLLVNVTFKEDLTR